MNESAGIPLFPLNVVLYPNARIPLYIFESRYKIMIEKSIKTGEPFGINLETNGKMYKFGCTAIVESIVNRLPGGEMNIIAAGIKRYLLVNYEMGLNEYYVGEVEYQEDNNLEFDRNKLEESVKKYNELIEIVYRGQLNKIDLSDIQWLVGSRSVSFHMAEKSGLHILERQKLLEINNENSRLDFMIDYFDEVMPKLEEAGKIAEIIKGDGYIQK
jgi:ATP-dependent Lon protease